VKPQCAAPEIFVAKSIKAEDLAALVGQPFSVFLIGSVGGGC